MKAKRYEDRAEMCNRRANQWDDDAELNERQARKLRRLLQFVLALLDDYEPQHA